MISKTFGNKEPMAVHAFEVTPEILREWASRLEAKAVVPGQIVRLSISSNAEFFFDPGLRPFSRDRDNAQISTQF